MDTKKLKASLIFIFSTFGSFLGSRYVTKNYGSKVHAEYGESALATGLATVAVSQVKKISNAEIGLGLIAGSGMNAVWSIASIPKIKEKLPTGIQTTLGSEVGEMGNNSLDSYSDQELMGNERVVNLARGMAENEKEAYVNALIAAAQSAQRMLPDNREFQTVGSSLPDYQAGLEGEEDELEGNSLD